ncbi:2'-5' RNA ligase family protein [Nocardia puris]|uniref:2'-5' RNA ligase superfamily protein n=1 Tax=Nocardia puris TaxID=208602 RepID=A0A366DH70_9NOCA|nr:2'-5' RNA ligase family protein [Nocardia puris]MBF6213250.1 2'-5' RNA ligase family protein [Nocardia puris]MBF6369842.1 2'-5' RNA ligase family protein [Nocardia puris]MBF6462129.1 2'-5' RNA ligase family protein [Nocardia puris]RBO89432.1 2'-5' RNA ligase superfamily protein [Nocardia puris]
MVQSVELLVDDAAEAEIRRQWDLLAEAGVTSLAATKSETHRPHITVAVAKQIWPRLDTELERMEFRPFPVRIGGVLVFGARHPILVRAVVPSEQLLAVHRRVSGIVAPCPGVPGNLRPDAWTPHLTLARRVPARLLGDAIHAVAADRDFTATIVGIRRWDGDHRRAWPVARGR